MKGFYLPLLNTDCYQLPPTEQMQDFCAFPAQLTQQTGDNYFEQNPKMSRMETKWA